MRQKLLLVSVLTVSTIAHAQRAAIKKVELAGEKIIVYYDLEDSNPANEYQIQLYASQSNFATALTKVKGDVGNEIKPGSDKKIEWNVRDEIGPYKGRLALEIRGRMFMAVARINSISEGDKFKRGKSHLVNWRPGNTNPVNIELLKAGQPVSTEINQPNSGAFNLFIPEHNKVGKDYTIRITDTKNPSDFVVSQPFAVTRKIPLLLKVLPVAAIGGAVYLLGGGGSAPQITKGIPDPPHPE
jgi:hypothetical protein